MTERQEIIITNNLKDLRKQHELSQEELADKLGISRQSIIALEHGKYMPSLPLAVSMCTLFDSAFEDIFEFEHEINKVFENINHNIVKEPTMPSDLGPWRPFREAVSLRDAMDRLFEDSVITPKTGGVMPKIDILETKTAIMVSAELPGIEEDKVNVEIMDNVMTISGEKVEEKVEDGEGYHYKESHSGAFARSFSLPADVKTEKAEAEMKNGVLMISVPKVEPKQAKKISIKAKAKK
ncbi:MAG: Hsp20 family protein [Candidatus Berkelbacteria bacterium]|nr:Hsp20 family protein [Candidatus Berkelbacteria bacterium]